MHRRLSLLLVTASLAAIGCHHDDATTVATSTSSGSERSEPSAPASSSPAPQTTSAASASPSSSVAPAVPPAPRDEHALERIVAGIHATSPTERTFTTIAFDTMLENLTTATGSLRVTPNTVNGHTHGLRLFGIRAGALFAVLGFQNGDVLESIDHLDISTPDRALEAYSRVRNAAVIEVGIVRAGAPVTLTFRRVP